jgi:hypothetical protein
MVKKNIFLSILIISSIIFFTSNTNAGNFGIGVHSGYGVIKYEEEPSAFGDDIESESKLDTILFGVSAEYSFNKPKNFFAGITTDWAFGLEDEERREENGIQIRTNDLKIFGQFYDIRFGYKNSLDRFYYRFYVSGGWDGLHFKRDNFMSRGISITDSVTEDFSLWRTGGGLGVGYKLGKLALDGRFAYAYYPEGTVEKNDLSQFEFDTNGTCLDTGIGIAREISKNINFYVGGSYTLLKLDEADVFPESKTQIIIGVVNLTYAF